MRYQCTIFTHSYTFGGGVGTEPSFDDPMADVVVSGGTMREAAARAYVKCVGRDRARRLAGRVPHNQEASLRAIAASLRKVSRRIGEVFELDNAVEAWLIKVEPAPATSPRLSRLRLPSRVLLHLCRNASPN